MCIFNLNPTQLITPKATSTSPAPTAAGLNLNIPDMEERFAQRNANPDSDSDSEGEAPMVAQKMVCPPRFDFVHVLTAIIIMSKRLPHLPLVSIPMSGWLTSKLGSPSWKESWQRLKEILPVRMRSPRQMMRS
jgi:hypothetical protein